MGQITCANVLSDLYSVGVCDIDKLQMMLSQSERFTEQETEVVLPLIIQGFRDKAKEAGISIFLPHVYVNPWCIIGGIATSICRQTEFIDPRSAKPGDVLILTKPLGAQIAANAYRWLRNPEKRPKILSVVDERQLKSAFNAAVNNMAQLNKTAAQLMHKYGARAATDVTGFGILGHADNLAKFQRDSVKFVIRVLPVLRNIPAIANVTGSYKKLLAGNLPETSGGLLISLQQADATLFIDEFNELKGYKPWIVGSVETGCNDAEIVENLKVIEI